MTYLQINIFSPNTAHKTEVHMIIKGSLPAFHQTHAAEPSERVDYRKAHYSQASDKDKQKDTNKLI